MNRVKSVNKVFLATVLISILGSFINSWILTYTDNYFFVLLMSQIILVIPSLLYLIIHRLNIAKAIRFHKIKVSNIILIIIFSYLISPLMNLINAISMLFVENATTDFMNNIITNNGFLISLLMVALIPCILEETVYRGIFYNEYSKVNPLKGIFLSGFLFGIIHGNFNQFSYAFAMGIVFALLIEAADSILATMIAHFFINGTSVLLVALYPKLFKILEELYGSEKFNADELINAVNSGISDNMDFGYIIRSYGITALIATVLAFIVYKTIAKNSGRWEYIKGIFTGNWNRETVGYNQINGYNQTDRNSAWDVDNRLSINNDYETSYKKRRLWTFSLIAGIIICIALMLVNEFYVQDTPNQNLGEFYSIIRFSVNQWFPFRM